MSSLRSVTIRPKHRGRQEARFTPSPYHVAGCGPKMRSIKSAGGRTVAYSCSRNRENRNVRRLDGYWPPRPIFCLSCKR